jgi:hypothetical protein
MAPTRSKKRKSTESEGSLDVPSLPAAPAQAKELRDAVRTPTGRSPIKKGPMRITSRQKQALIDNLQLESKSISSKNICKDAKIRGGSHRTS